MKLKLVELTKEYQGHLNEMMDEWLSVETIDQVVPSSIIKNDYHDFDNYLSNLNVTIPTDKLVPDTTYFCLDEDSDKFVGAVNIRHRLNDHLLNYGGHIGDGIRPSKRGQGIGTQMIKLALEKCCELKIDEVLMTCDKNNIASSRTIIKNGGILENEVLENDGKQITQRYWIKNK